MKKKLNSNIIWIFIFIIGLLILLYPTISDVWNKKAAQSLITEYESIVQTIDKKDISSLKEAAIKYNESLVGTTVPDAFAFEEANSPNEYYESLLNPIGNGLMGMVEIPCIDVNLPIYHYTTEEVLLKGAGHLPGSSLPIGGDSTHTVISAHRGLPSAKLFTDLDRVRENDIFYFKVLDETIAYQVDLIKTIEPSDTSDLSITVGKDYATLFTCTPYGINSHRLLVRGHRIPYSEEQYLIEHTKTNDANYMLVLLRIASVLLGIIFALLIIIVGKKIKDRKNKKELVNEQSSKE